MKVIKVRKILKALRDDGWTLKQYYDKCDYGHRTY